MEKWLPFFYIFVIIFLSSCGKINIESDIERVDREFKPEYVKVVTDKYRIEIHDQENIVLFEEYLYNIKLYRKIKF